MRSGSGNGAAIFSYRPPLGPITDPSEGFGDTEDTRGSLASKAPRIVLPDPNPHLE